MSSPTLLDPEERVLSTLNADGSRRWIRPTPAPGRFHNRRRAVGYFLIGLFTVLPHLRMYGKPPLLLDIGAREFTFFGTTLYPTDTLLLALLLVSGFVSIFLITAIFGRVWCGWACPQTVYLELLYRPIERFFDGTPGRKSKAGAWRKPAKYAVFFVVSFVLAHTFVAYFIPTDRLFTYMTESPASHPVPFFVVVAVTGLMLFDFGFFREQTCIVACPYGRFQSVLLDSSTLIISYDKNRGEPRGKVRKGGSGEDHSAGGIALPVLGDCIDCRKCVTCCPTGIDIREGLQLECVNCAQCIDACDSVMDKLGRARGLVGYHTQASLEGGKARLARPRLVGYVVLLTGLMSVFVAVFLHREPAYVMVLRGLGNPYVVLDDGMIANTLRIRIQDRTREGGLYRVSAVGLDGAELVSEAWPIEIGSGEFHTESVLVKAPADVFATGHAVVTLRVESGSGFTKDVSYKLMGPFARRSRSGGGVNGAAEVIGDE